MELKYLAVVFVLGISFFTAYYIKKKGEEKLLVNEAICDLIEYIKNHIEFFCTPVDEILSNYENPVLEKYGFLSFLEDNDWENALHESRAGSFLDKRTAALLDSFSKRLGTGTAEEEVAGCEYTLKELRAVLDVQKSEVPKKSKAFSAISVVSGFMAVILIL